MRFPKTVATLALLVAGFIVVGQAETAQAQTAITKTYKVQVEYWFFDTDYYYWSTVLETDSLGEAQFLYDVLLWAKENNSLNAAAPNSYWRYIAVDVRLITEYHYPRFEHAGQFNLKPVYQARPYSLK